MMARSSPPNASCTCLSSRRLTPRSEEHTSELQSQSNLVCRLLLEKKEAPQPVAWHISHILKQLTSMSHRMRESAEPPRDVRLSSRLSTHGGNAITLLKLLVIAAIV